MKIFDSRGAKYARSLTFLLPFPRSSNNSWTRLARCALAIVLLSLTGCSYYSFTGATIPQEYETIAIVPIEDQTANPFGGLDNDLTELLNERFVQRTRLRLETNQNEADVVLTGRLTQYRDEPTAVSGEERATRNQVTIRAEMRYYEQESGDELAGGTYTQSEEYDLAATGAEGAQVAAEVVLEDIADAVFSDATSNW